MPPASGATTRLPEIFNVLLLLLNVPYTLILVKDRVLPVLSVQVPFAPTSIEPSIEKLFPDTVTGAPAKALLAAVVAVFPENVTPGRLVPSRATLPPATERPPPLLPAELLEKVLVAIVTASVLSRSKPAPLAVTELFEKVDPLMLADPVPLLNAYRSRPPPPLVAAAAALCEYVVLVEVYTPGQGQGLPPESMPGP